MNHALKAWLIILVASSVLMGINGDADSDEQKILGTWSVTSSSSILKNTQMETGFHSTAVAMAGRARAIN